MKPADTETQKNTAQSHAPTDEPEMAAFSAYEHAISKLQKEVEQNLNTSPHKLADPFPKNK